MKRIIIICLLASGVIFGQSIPTSHGRYVSGTLSPGQLITFSGSLSHDNDIINELCAPRYEWDFIFNGTFSANISTTSATVNYTYPNAGLFTVAMKYYDNDCQAGNIYTFTIEIVGLTRYYYIKDQLGSVRITMNQQGNVVSGQDYYPYGEICRSINNADPNDKYKFTEKERDTETNLDYFGARYFDSQISRWLSVDPLADKYPGWSPYNYTLNNPLRMVDPNGKFPVEVHAAIMDEVYGFSFGMNFLYNAYMDLPVVGLGNSPEFHFDDYNSFDEINSVISSAGGFSNLPGHTIGDFYSHSNYVDIWAEMNPFNDNIPAFQEIDWDSKFGKAVRRGLKCTTYHTKDPSRDHDNGDPLKAKDYPGDTPLSIRLNKLAIDSYRKSLQIVKEENEQRRIRNIDDYNSYLLYYFTNY